MTESSTDRTLFALFIIIAILAIIVYFTRGFATGLVRPITYTTQYRTAPASAGTVVRAIGPVSNNRTRSYYSSNSSSTYTNTIPGDSTTTTYYQNY